MTTAVDTDNQFAALASSPRDEGKDSIASLKDDVKEQAYQARAGVKARAVDLKEQLVDSVASTLGLAKQKLAGLTGDPSLAKASTREIAAKGADAAAGEWETVKSRGKKQAKAALDEAEERIDANLSAGQKRQLKAGLSKAKAAGKQGVRQAEGIVGRMLSVSPQLRGVKSFVLRNHLQLPVLIGVSLLGLWASLTVIRLVTLAATPSVPEFDIHSKEASLNWLKFHAGEYKDRALDAKESLSGRVAAFIANHELDKIKAEAIDWKDIGMRRLGLAEPTWSEWAWSYVTGRPVTWQGRVESLVSLGKAGLKASAKASALPGQAAAAGLKAYASHKLSDAKEAMGLREPTLLERARDYVTGHDSSLKGRVADGAEGLSDRLADAVDGLRQRIPGLHRETPLEQAQGVLGSVKDRLADGVAELRAHLPGGESVEAARARAYAATHPSTLDNLRSGAEYVKNRIVHGAQEAAHIAQDRANEIADKAKYKTGL